MFKGIVTSSTHSQQQSVSTQIRPASWISCWRNSPYLSSYPGYLTGYISIYPPLSPVKMKTILWLCVIAIVAVSAQDGTDLQCPPDVTSSCLKPLDQLEVPQAPGAPEDLIRKMCSVWTPCLGPPEKDCECHMNIDMHMLRVHEDSYLYCKQHFPGFPASAASMHLAETCLRECMAKASEGISSELIPTTREEVEGNKRAMSEVLACYKKCPVRTKYAARYLYAMYRLMNHTFDDFKSWSDCGQRVLVNCENPASIWEIPFAERCEKVANWATCSQNHLAACDHDAAGVQKYFDLNMAFSMNQAYMPCGCEDVDVIAKAIKEAEAYIDTTE